MVDNEITFIAFASVTLLFLILMILYISNLPHFFDIATTTIKGIFKTILNVIIGIPNFVKYLLFIH